MSDKQLDLNLCIASATALTRYHGVRRLEDARESAYQEVLAAREALERCQQRFAQSAESLDEERALYRAATAIEGCSDQWVREEIEKATINA